MTEELLKKMFIKGFKCSSEYFNGEHMEIFNHSPYESAELNKLFLQALKEVSNEY